MGEGGTPFLQARRLGESVGCEDLWLKDESRNPTGSFKDRGTAVAVAVLAAAGVEVIGTVSTGNMARSVAAYAARAGLRAMIWVGASTPAHKLAPIAIHGANLVRIDAPYGEIYRASMEWGADNDVVFVNSDSALRVEGQKTIAYEIAEQCVERPLDWLLVPTSSGGNFSAIGKGFRELADEGFLERSPRLVAVQAEGCSPIASAWEAGMDSPADVGPARTIAGAISNPTPPSGARALRWARDTGGLALKVSDEEILSAQAEIAALTGRFVQPASAAGLAALRRLRQSGTIGEEERVAALLTGAGPNAPPPPLEIPEPVKLAELVEA
jgi:threonine synthase